MNKKYRIEEVFSSNCREEYLDQIKNCGWVAGEYLVTMIKNGDFFKMCTNDARLFVLLDEKKVCSFCTFVYQDEIYAPNMFPWIGFVFTFPQYRGHRLIGILFDYIYDLAIREKYNHIYVSTNEIGLYEKYGFDYHRNMIDITGNDSRIYIRKL